MTTKTIYEKTTEEIGTLDWQLITKEGEYAVYRAKVFGGWLLQNHAYSYGTGIAQSLLFIPDPKHEWSLNKYLTTTLR